jgi:RNA polymerase sigma factor (sigma-70 family)
MVTSVTGSSTDHPDAASPSAERDQDRDRPGLAPTRWSLIERLKDSGDDTSWREFFDTYARLIHSVARKAGLTDTEAQEVVQETVIAVAKKMPAFRCDPQAGSFKGFLLHITGRRITDQFRKRARSAPGAAAGSGGTAGSQRSDADAKDRTSTIDRVPDASRSELETLWDEEWRAHWLEIAGDRVRQQVDPEQYQMFELHVLRGEPAREVARKLGVTVARVYFAKYRISKLLKTEIQALRENGPAEPHRGEKAMG